MGTTRVKVIDMSSVGKETKPAKKHAGKLTKTEVKDELQTEDVTQKNVKEEIIDQQTEEVSPKTEPSKSPKTLKSSKPSIHHKGKKYQNAKSQIEDKLYSIKEALEILPKTSFVKFDPAVEIHLNVNDKNIKGNVTFPHLKQAKQKSQKFLIFSDKKEEITNQNVIWSDDKTISHIEDQTLKPGRDFDVVIANPKFMPALARVAKILGPKGMMPNPKNGTITEKPKEFFQAPKDEGQTSYKTDPQAAIIHLKIGKLSQDPQEIQSNLRALITSVGQNHIRKATLTTTMGPAIKVDIARA